MEAINKPEYELTFDDETPSETDDNGESKSTKAFDPTQINILPKQDSLSNLIGRLKNDEVDMNTEFQRHADLWNDEKMSKFIESILIRFPIPAFYFDASDDNNWLIVDGLQRLSTIRKFVVEKKLKLRGLEYLTKELDGKSYDDIPRIYQRRINECPVTLFILQPGTPEEVKYSIFRRINTGGLVLNNQEIRNALAPKNLREFIAKLAKNEFLVKTVGDQSKRMIDQELVLRFLAFYTMNYTTHEAKSITTFLDDMIKKMKKTDDEELLKLENIFYAAMQRSWDIFEKEAFEKCNIDGKKPRREKNSTLFEVWTVTLAKLSAENFAKILLKRAELLNKHENLMMKDADYFKSITLSTQKRDHFKIRHQKVNQIIGEVLND